MNTSEIIVASLRGMHVAALMSLFGTLVFLVLIALTTMKEAAEGAQRFRFLLMGLACTSTACALIIAIGWLLIEAAVIAGADSFLSTLQALPVVAWRTQFGRWMLLRCALLLAVLPMLRLRRTGLILAVFLAGLALAVQPMIGHAGAIGGRVGDALIISEVMHLWAAGAWLGGLLPLFITIAILPHSAAATACRSFTPVGLSAIVMLGGTAVVQVAEFMGGLPGLFGTAYGQIALVKLELFVVLLVLAALNRLALTDRLAGPAPDAAQRQMRASIAIEAVLGGLVVIVAGFLASHMPGTHEQPVWPFAWRPSLSAFDEADLRAEVIATVFAMGVTVVIAIATVIWRKVRWPGLALAALILVVAIPHLNLLLVKAYPTSFFTSPTEFAATAIAHGAKLYMANCAACHGNEGHGDGPAAKSFSVSPADLTADHLWAHSDGELFWYISHGFVASKGGMAMPGFEAALSSEARWDLVDYLRAHNAGESMRTIGKWSHPVSVPQFDATCGNGRSIDLDDLRGRVLRIIAVSGAEATMLVPPASTGITTIILTGKQTTRSDQTACVASEPEAWPVFAILLGVSGDALAGKQVLVDQSGWLRAQWQPGDPGDWTNLQVLATVVRDIAAHPITADTGGGHAHHH